LKKKNSSKYGEFGSFFSWNILCIGWNHIFQVENWQKLARKRNTGWRAWDAELITTKICWEFCSNSLVNFLSHHGCHLKLESEISFPSSNFRGEEIWLHLKFSYKFLANLFFAFGVFKVICEIILSKFGTYLFQIVEFRACE